MKSKEGIEKTISGKRTKNIKVPSEDEVKVNKNIVKVKKDTNSGDSEVPSAKTDTMSVSKEQFEELLAQNRAMQKQLLDLTEMMKASNDRAKAAEERAACAEAALTQQRAQFEAFVAMTTVNAENEKSKKRGSKRRKTGTPSISSPTLSSAEMDIEEISVDSSSTGEFSTGESATSDESDDEIATGGPRRQQQ